jgi:hypothetical protein
MLLALGETRSITSARQRKVLPMRNQNLTNSKK